MEATFIEESQTFSERMVEKFPHAVLRRTVKNLHCLASWVSMPDEVPVQKWLVSEYDIFYIAEWFLSRLDIDENGFLCRMPQKGCVARQMGVLNDSLGRLLSLD